MSQYKPCFLNFCLPLLLAAVLPAGCGEGSYGPPRKAQSVYESGSTAPESSTSAKTGESMLVVGDIAMPMPAPAGFRRIPGDHTLMRTVQSSLDPDEVLLCLFERAAEGAGGRPQGGMSPASLVRRELLQISTLAKWLDLKLSSLEFLKIKQPWQDESMEFTQSALNEFAEAARGDLSAEREFSYNMGMIDSSPLHISFMRVEKHAGQPGGAVYTCDVISLIWRYGKILRVTYSKPIENFGQIPGVVAESVGYVQQLRAIDRNTRLSSVYDSDSDSAQNSHTYNFKGSML